MSIPTGPDPIDRLHAADPIHADDVPDASLARVTARIQEHIMTTQKNDPTVRHPRGPLAWVGGFAVVGAIALAFAIALGNGFGAQTPPPVAAVPTPSEAPIRATRTRPATRPPAVASPRASSTTRRTCPPSRPSSTAPSPPSMATRSPSR